MATPSPTRTTAGPTGTETRTLTVIVAPGDPAGYPITHPYIENLYLPLIGPSTYVLLRLLDRLADDHPDTYTLRLDDLAHRIGLGSNGTANRTTHTLDRLCNYRLAARTAPDTIIFPRRLPDLARLDRHYRMTRNPTDPS